MNAEPIKASEYLNGFNFMSKEQLSDFSATNNLSFSTEQLLYIQSYFKNEKKMFPTLEQIKFFDELNRIRISKKDDFSVFCATAENNTDCQFQHFCFLQIFKLCFFQLLFSDLLFTRYLRKK